MSVDLEWEEDDQRLMILLDSPGILLHECLNGWFAREPNTFQEITHTVFQTTGQDRSVSSG